jgi:hypothetical protein
MQKTLRKFLEKHHACADSYEFAKDLTLEEFLKTCERGDWMLRLFAITNKESLREITLAKAHCANTVRHLMKDERSIAAVDVAIKFGNGEATRVELDAAAAEADDARASAYAYADARAEALGAAFADARAALGAAYADARAALGAAYAAYVAAYADAYPDAVAREANQKLTADICREYLPLEIWDQSKL